MRASEDWHSCYKMWVTNGREQIGWKSDSRSNAQYEPTHLDISSNISIATALSFNTCVLRHEKGKGEHFGVDRWNSQAAIASNVIQYFPTKSPAEVSPLEVVMHIYGIDHVRAISSGAGHWVITGRRNHTRCSVILPVAAAVHFRWNRIFPCRAPSPVYYPPHLLFQVLLKLLPQCAILPHLKLPLFSQLPLMLFH